VATSATQRYSKITLVPACFKGFGLPERTFFAETSGCPVEVRILFFRRPRACRIAQNVALPPLSTRESSVACGMTRNGGWGGDPAVVRLPDTPVGPGGSAATSKASFNERTAPGVERRAH